MENDENACSDSESDFSYVSNSSDFTQSSSYTQSTSSSSSTDYTDISEHETKQLASAPPSIVDSSLPSTQLTTTNFHPSINITHTESTQTMPTISGISTSSYPEQSNITNFSANTSIPTINQSIHQTIPAPSNTAHESLLQAHLNTGSSISHFSQQSSVSTYPDFPHIPGQLQTINPPFSPDSQDPTANVIPPQPTQTELTTLSSNSSLYAYFPYDFPNDPGQLCMIDPSSIIMQNPSAYAIPQQPILYPIENSALFYPYPYYPDQLYTADYYSSVTHGAPTHYFNHNRQNTSNQRGHIQNPDPKRQTPKAKSKAAEQKPSTLSIESKPDPISPVKQHHGQESKEQNSPFQQNQHQILDFGAKRYQRRNKEESKQFESIWVYKPGKQQPEKQSDFTTKEQAISMQKHEQHDDKSKQSLSGKGPSFGITKKEEAKNKNEQEFKGPKETAVEITSDEMKPTKDSSRSKTAGTKQKPQIIHQYKIEGKPLPKSLAITAQDISQPVSYTAEKVVEKKEDKTNIPEEKARLDQHKNKEEKPTNSKTSSTETKKEKGSDLEIKSKEDIRKQLEKTEKNRKKRAKRIAKRSNRSSHLTKQAQVEKHNHSEESTHSHHDQEEGTSIPLQEMPKQEATEVARTLDHAGLEEENCCFLCLMYPCYILGNCVTPKGIFYAN